MFYTEAMASAVLVETQQGKLEGEQRGAHSVFRGIPYATPPVGRLRFRAPEPAEPWTGVRQARVYAASALQGAAFAPGVGAEGPTSEDCLYLNVFTKAVGAAHKRAVMFFIHGGAFTVGSSSSPLYDAGRLAEQHDVVVVTINYRVGALGYLALGAAGERWGAVDNRGQLDQLEALRWVQANIGAFGGDPGNVTIFGESAGATAVCLLLATPSARGLFKRAISQSSPNALTLPSAEQAAELTTHDFLAALDLSPDHGERLLDVSADALIAAQARVENNGRWPHFYPVADRLFGGQPRDTLLSGRGNAVPLIIGTNRDEWNLFALATLPDWERPLEDADLLARLVRKLPPAAGGSAAAIIETYRSSRRERALPYGNRALLRAIEGDYRFRIPSLRFAELYRELSPETYVYLFTYESPALRGALGACHALELPFVFGTYDAPNQDRFAGQGDAVATLSRTMTATWTQFAKTGETTTEHVASWPGYDARSRATLEINVEPRLVDDAFGAERRAWDGVI
ncbi:MAG: Carboxylic ester hydrolase [Myxococcaceae bacterium]|nr:Carboxylic ester hydrolase [Myxococcaceae bacterium]